VGKFLRPFSTSVTSNEEFWRQAGIREVYDSANQTPEMDFDVNREKKIPSAIESQVLIVGLTEKT
jgi:hypothetical protein